MSAPPLGRPDDGTPPAGHDAAAWLRAQRPRLAALRAAPAPDSTGAAHEDALHELAECAEVGTRLPSLMHLGGLRRRVAERFGRLVLYFLRLLSVDQSRFNQLVVRALAGLEARASDSSAAAQRALAAAEARHAELAAKLETVIAQHAAALTALETQQAQVRRQQQAVLARLDAWRGAGGEPPDSAARGADDRPHIDVRTVAAAFRGDEAALRERQRRYVPLFAGRTDVLDIGCGRGEFLELLREAGIPARGIDADPAPVRCCQDKGLDVICADALTALQQTPPASLDGVFCAQVIEHLPTADMLRLIELAARALRPDGVLVVETLNPESLLVLYRWFWADPTHERLVHPDTLRSIFTAAGLRDIELRFVPPPEGAVRLPLLAVPGLDDAALAEFNRATQYLNDLLYGSFDYAVIGVR